MPLLNKVTVGDGLLCILLLIKSMVNLQNQSDLEKSVLVT